MLVLALVAVAAWHLASRPPAAATLLSRAQAARSKLTGISFVLSSPWPQAQSSVSGLPGARALLGAVEGDRSWRVLWRSDGSMRAELLEPEETAGVLTIVSPGATWVWSPLLGVAISADSTGPAPLWVDEVLALASAAADRAGRSSLKGGAFVADFPVANPAGGTLRVAFDRKSRLPASAQLLDGNGRLLSSLAASQVDLTPAIGGDDFAFAPPDGARVLTFGQVQGLPSVAAAAAAGLPFAPVQPGYLPEGFQVAAVNVFGRGDAASLVLTYRRPGDASGSAGGLLSLTQARAGAGYQPLPYGMPVAVGSSEGRSFELGELRGLDWSSGDNALTVFGTVSASELLRVAASVR